MPGGIAIESIALTIDLMVPGRVDIDDAKVTAIAEFGGLHHRYERLV